MPELPEVEVTARLLSDALAGSRIESATAPGLNTLKTFERYLHELAGKDILGVHRAGKLLIVDISGELHLLIHLMSAGRLQLFEGRAGPRDRTSRLLVRLEDGGELRLREFGTRQAAWVRLLTSDGLAADETLASLGPEAWPEPPAAPELQAMLAAAGARPLYSVLRDQRVIAGIGRSWVDEILWTAQLSPFQRATDVTDKQAGLLRSAIAQRLGDAVDHYDATLSLPIPDKLPKPLLVHGHDGEPCPRCGDTLAAVHYEKYVMCYCPNEQAGGMPFKDRRLSRLLK